MALGLSLKLNNQTVDGSGTPIRITEGYFTLNWEFNLINKVEVDAITGIFTDIGNYAQSSYEVIISTLKDGLETDNFIGDVARTGVVAGQDLFWRYVGLPLERGIVYYGQVAVTDEIGQTTEWTTFSFSYNSLPYADNVIIIPSSPSVTDELQLTYDFNSADGDLESGTIIRWFKNGSHQRQLDNAIIIESQFLQINDIWNADVYPSDGYEYGSRVTSHHVVVRLTAIEADNMKILPRNPNPNDMLKADYIMSDEFEHENVFIRWYINDQILQELNDQPYVRPSLQEGDRIKFEIKHEEAPAYVSSPVVTIVASDFIVTNITIDGKIDPLDVSTITPYVQWEDFVPNDKAVNYISVKIGSFFESDDVYSTVLGSSRHAFIIPPNTLARGRDYYISISESDSQTFDKYASAHFRVKGSRWEEKVSNSTGWTMETLLSVDVVTDVNHYQVIRINDGSKFAEVRIYSSKIQVVSGSSIEYEVDATSMNILTVAGQGENIKIYLNRELIINGEGIFTQISNIRRLELGDFSSTGLVIIYKYLFYTVSGYFLPGVSEEYTNLQFHTYMDFEDNEIVSLQGDVAGKYVFGLNSDNNNKSSAIYAIKSDDQVKTGTIARTFSPINRINKSPDGKTTVCAHAKGTTILTGYLINPFSHELIFVDNNNNLHEVLPQNDGWELFSNSSQEAGYFDSEGFHINTIES